MVKDRLEDRIPEFSAPILIIVGGFGSGKTEIAVNLARYMTEVDKSPVTIADLDLVNPYFRSRETVIEMERLGIRVIAPRGGHFFADLPILLPEIKGAIEDPRGRLILDVGGDAQGARALGSLAGEFLPGRYEMLMILNSRRPSTDSVSGAMATMERVAAAAKLGFTGLVSNSHMIEETTDAIVMEGYRLALEIASATGLPIRFISAKREVLERLELSEFACALLPLSRLMLKPWERKESPAMIPPKDQRS